MLKLTKQIRKGGVGGQRAPKHKMAYYHVSPYIYFVEAYEILWRHCIKGSCASIAKIIFEMATNLQRQLQAQGDRSLRTTPIPEAECSDFHNKT